MQVRRVVRVAITCALALTATACWPQPGANAGRTNHNGTEDRLTIDIVGSLEPAWEAPMVLGPVWGGAVLGADIDYDGTNGSASAEIVSRDVATGADRWRTDVIDPTIADQVATTFVSEMAVVGEELWTSHHIQTEAFSCGQSVLRMDRDHGTLISSSPGFRYQLLPYGELVFVSSGGACPPVPRRAWILDATTGDVVWAPPNWVNGQAVYDAGLLTVSGGVTLSSFAGAGCGAATCAPRWTVDLGAFAVPEAAAGGIVVARVTSTGASSLVGLASDDGATLWTTSLPAGEPVVDVAIASGTVYVTYGTTLAAFALSGCGSSTCSPRWTAPLGTSATAGPISAAGVVYVGETDGTVRMFDAAGCGTPACDAVAAVAVADTVTELVVDGGRLFVESQGQHLWETTAFAPAPGAGPTS